VLPLLRTYILCWINVMIACILIFSLMCYCRIYRWIAAQSVFYHLYNQVSYMSLDQISPLTFSIGNTMKRISVIVSSIIIFRTPVRPVNALGAAIAILGTFLYSQVTWLLQFFHVFVLFLYILKQLLSSELGKEIGTYV
jgi:hypothetical protein